MGRELQKKKNRSSINKVRRKPKSKKRILSNHIIAANWDNTQTLAQNYNRLGLTARLNKNTGGVEKTVSILEKQREEEEEEGTPGVHPHGLVIGSGSKRSKHTMEVQEVEVERDPKTGKILRVLSTSDSKANPLNDPLNDLESDSEASQNGVFDQHANPTSTQPSAAASSKTDVVKKLQEQADRPVEKYQRKQSEGERDFIEELVRKYGDDYGRMARDMKINYMQRSEGDLKRRVKKWRASGGIIS